MKILRLDCSGHPVDWINFEEAASIISKDQMVWSVGNTLARLHGGVNSRGVRSYMDLPAILASEGKQKISEAEPALNNRSLIRRDQNLCLYCGNEFPDRLLTRDHVVPRCQNGPDQWSNVVAACKRCNNAKGGRTPEQAGMKLIAVPFAPNPIEYLYLINRHIVADQMEYLKSRMSKRRQWQ